MDKRTYITSKHEQLIFCPTQANTELKETNSTTMEISEDNADSERENTSSSPPALDNSENERKESREEQIFVEIQDELNQQKDCLLKDIRLIQKRKIKEMEELYELKLKKKTYEQELEDTKLEIKKMDEHFEFLRKKKAELSASVSKDPETSEVERKKVDNGQDVKIIENKRPAPPQPAPVTSQPGRDDSISVIEEIFPRPKYSSSHSSHSSGRGRTNLVESSGHQSTPPPYYGHGAASKEKHQGGHQGGHHTD